MSDTTRPTPPRLADNIEFWRHDSAEARDKCEELRAEIERITRELTRTRKECEIHKQAVDRWVPCPDHRDKTERGICYVCAAEAAERARDEAVAENNRWRQSFEEHVYVEDKEFSALAAKARTCDEAVADARELRMQILSDECQHQENYQRAEAMEHAKNEYATLAANRWTEIERLRAEIERLTN